MFFLISSFTGGIAWWILGKIFPFPHRKEPFSNEYDRLFIAHHKAYNRTEWLSVLVFVLGWMMFGYLFARLEEFRMSRESAFFYIVQEENVSHVFLGLVAVLAFLFPIWLGIAFAQVRSWPLFLAFWRFVHFRHGLRLIIPSSLATVLLFVVLGFSLDEYQYQYWVFKKKYFYHANEDYSYPYKEIDSIGYTQLRINEEGEYDLGTSPFYGIHVGGEEVFSFTRKRFHSEKQKREMLEFVAREAEVPIPIVPKIDLQQIIDSLKRVQGADSLAN